MNINKYKSVVKLFQEYIDERAVLAGGAVRDTIFNVEVKDLDFVTQSASVTPNDCKLVWPDQEFHYIGNDEIEAYDNGDGIIIRVIESLDKTINVIKVEDIHEYIMQFPDSISRVWYNGDFVDYGYDWLQTIQDGTVEYRSDMKPERLEKLKTKYPTLDFKEKR